MNGTASKRSASVLEWAPPPELIGAGAGANASGDRRRGGRFAHGLHVQVAYAAIDIALVCLGGIAIFLLRFSLVHHMGITAALFRSAPAHAYLGFFLLYAGLIVLCCVSQNLYRTPRDRSVVDEGWMVVKAVSVATSLLEVF